MAPSRTREIVAWVACVALALLFTSSGVPKASGASDALASFERWGFTASFARLIGGLEIAGGLGLIFPASATWAALGLVGVMGGALVTHLQHDPPATAAVPAVLIVLLLGVAWLRRGRALPRVGHGAPEVRDTGGDPGGL